MKTKTLLTVLALASIALGACSPIDGGQAGGASLVGSRWVLQTLNGQPPLDDTTPTAEFSESEIGGSAGCNHYFGSYQATGSDLTVTNVGMTEMFCMEPEGVMEQEQAFLSALTAVAAYRLAPDRLELLDTAGTALLVFAPPPPEPEVALDGTTWVLTTFIEGEAATSTISGTTITLRFEVEEGVARGSAGCNLYGGAYTLRQGTVSIAPADRTDQLCLEPAGIMEQEARYLDILPSLTTFELDADQLTLRTADGRGLVFTSLPAAP